MINQTREHIIKILYFDSIAGLLAGIIVLIALPLIVFLHDWPIQLAVFIGVTNILYGCYSGYLSFKHRKNLKIQSYMVKMLVTANSIWSIFCIILAILLFNSISIFGLIHLVAEGVFVGALAFVELKILLPYINSLN